MGYFMGPDPSPQIFATYSVEMGQRVSKHRIAPMIRDSPSLRGKVKEARSRDSGNTILDKEYDGGQLTITGANSPGAMAGYPKRVALGDEVDRWPESAGSEGDPYEILTRRLVGWRNRVEVFATSPGDKKKNRSWRLWELTDKREWHVPCPYCGHVQILRFEQVKWDRDERGNHLPLTARYICEETSCGASWSDRDRHTACKRGRYVATAPFAGRVGFRCNALGIAGGTKLAEIVKHWLRVQGNPHELRVFVNTVLCDWWEDTESVDDDELVGRCRDWNLSPRVVVPDGVAVLTLGADVQGNRVEYEVIGWGRGEESWSIDYGVIPGDIRKDLNVLRVQLEQILMKPWMHASGHPLYIRAACIDASYAQHTVQQYTKTRGSRPLPSGFSQFVFAVKGRDAGDLWPEKPTKTKHGLLWVINVSATKMQVLGRLGIAEPGPGYSHFPLGRDREYFQGLTAEEYKLVYRAGRQAVAFDLKSPGRRNEPLDCRGYGYAAFVALQTPPFSMSLEREVQRVQLLPRIPVRPESPDGGSPTPAPRAPVQRGRRAISRGYEA